MGRSWLVNDGAIHPRVCYTLEGEAHDRTFPPSLWHRRAISILLWIRERCDDTWGYKTKNVQPCQQSCEAASQQELICKYLSRIMLNVLVYSVTYVNSMF